MWPIYRIIIFDSASKMRVQGREIWYSIPLFLNKKSSGRLPLLVQQQAMKIEQIGDMVTKCRYQSK